MTVGALTLDARMAPPESDVRRIWPEGRLRLFLSHVSAHKIAVSKLKDELGHRGVAAFVAHEDIEPSLEWQREIELALSSMHSLAALITPDFHASAWTDQEVGWAFARGVLVLPIRLGADPYGFLARIQGASGSLDQPNPLAISMVKALLSNPQTNGEMRRSLVRAFAGSTSFIMTQALRKLVVEITNFTEEEKATLRTACTENYQVANAHYVPDAIYSAFGGPAETKPREEENDPSF